MFYIEIKRRNLFIIGMNVISEFIAGIIIPGSPIANAVFKVYGYGSSNQVMNLLGNLKLGHYMKVYHAYY
jgi:hypothetical protein